MSETAVSVCILTDFCSFGIKGLRKTGKYEHMKPYIERNLKKINRDT